MDIAPLLKFLDKTSRQVVVSAAISFPMAYADCWILYPQFRALDWFPQIMLSIAGAFIVAIAGFSIVCTCWPQIARFGLSPVLAVLPFYGASSYLLLSDSPRWLEFYSYFSICSCFIVLIRVFGLIADFTPRKNSCHNKKKEKSK